MSSGLSIGDIVAIVQLVKNVQIKITEYANREELNRTTLVIASSKQKIDLWFNTWLVDASNDAQYETLWGKDGWDDIQKKLLEIRTRTTSFNDMVEPEISKMVRKPWFLRSKSTSDRRTDSTILKKSPTILEKALILEQDIDELWTYSEITFDSLHGLLAQAVVRPAGKKELEESTGIRNGILALYYACQRSKVQCNLDLHLRGQPMEKMVDRNLLTQTPESNLVLHLFIERPGPTMRSEEVAIESFGPEHPENCSTVKLDEEPSLETLIQKLWSSGGRPTRITTRDASEAIFRIPSRPILWTPQAEGKTLAQILYESRTPTRIKKTGLLSLSSKLELAYQLAEFTFFLLGTPWLGHLSSKHLRRIKDREDKDLFTLSIRPTPLDDLYLSDPNALSESSQLLHLGIILIEVALGTPDESDPNDVKDPYLRASQMLSRVQMYAGTQYYDACSFCIQHRRSTSPYNHPEKYRYSHSMGWDVYLRNLLEEYDTQVLSRYDDQSFEGAEIFN